MKEIINFVYNSSKPLFKTSPVDKLLASFDDKGFWFSDEAQSDYKKIKDEPHLYVAYGNGWYYIGKSFQPGGRWKRSSAYHLGTLVHVLIGSNKKDHKHGHWNNAWMDLDSTHLSNEGHTIMLLADIRIAFVPYILYGGGIDYKVIKKDEVRLINDMKETELIAFYREVDGVKLLNRNKRNK
jgi:hypothetical protein